MTEQTPAANGTVAEEAAWLIDAMASMARSSAGPGQRSSPYAGGPARGSSEAPDSSGGAGHREDTPADGTCSACGGASDSTPAACRLCPLCQGIAFLRSIRPETVERLADLATALAVSLRDVATQSRSSHQASPGGPASRTTSGGGRATVEDIPVDDEEQG